MKLLTEQQQEKVEQLFAIIGSADEYLKKATLEDSAILCYIYSEFRPLWNYEEKGNISDFRKNIQGLVDLFIDENNLSDSWECRSGFLFSVVDYDLVYSIPYTYKSNPHIEIRYRFLQWLEAKLK